MGENSRKFSEKYFDAKIINDQIVRVIEGVTCDLGAMSHVGTMQK
jgi:hypothetical protein